MGIKVPQRMCEDIGAYWPAKSEYEAQRTLDIIRAVLTWQKVNPPVPTEEQARSIYLQKYVSDYDQPDDLTNKIKINAMVEWVRRMYDEPEGEVPPDEVKNMLWGDWHRARGLPDSLDGWATIESHNNQVIEAFKRGQKAGPR